MKRTLAAAAIAIVPCSCARVPPRAPLWTEPSATATAPRPSGTYETFDAADAVVGPAAEMRLRSPGDYVVYRFTGKTRPRAMSLTERVVAQDGDATTLDFTLVEGVRSKTLRVRMGGSAAEPKVVSAAWMDGAIEGPVSVKAYEHLLEKTILAADRNDGLVSSEDVQVEVGGRMVPCKRDTYRVAVGRREATMTVLKSDAFPWGDVGGEVRAKDGAVLYRAEVVEMGHSEAPAEVAETK
jgi:hypothetical protein